MRSHGHNQGVVDVAENPWQALVLPTGDVFGVILLVGTGIGQGFARDGWGHGIQTESSFQLNDTLSE